MLFPNSGEVVGVVTGEDVLVDEDTSWLSVVGAGIPVSEAGVPDVTCDLEEVHRLYQAPQIEVTGREELSCLPVDIVGSVLETGMFMLVVLIGGGVEARSTEGSTDIFTHFVSSSSLYGSGKGWSAVRLIELTTIELPSPVTKVAVGLSLNSSKVREASGRRSSSDVYDGRVE